MKIQTQSMLWQGLIDTRAWNYRSWDDCDVGAVDRDWHPRCLKAENDSILQAPPANSVHVELRPAFGPPQTDREITIAQLAGIHNGTPTRRWVAVVVTFLVIAATLGAVVLGILGNARW